MALSGHQKTSADQRSLVAASKPDLVILDTPELNAETRAAFEVWRKERGI